MRIKFKRGGQRRFLDLVVVRLRAPSVRGILQFGFDIPYSTLKNYYNGSRLLPLDLFNDLCEVAGIDKGDLYFEEVNENWGKVRGGKAHFVEKLTKVEKLTSWKSSPLVET